MRSETEESIPLGFLDGVKAYMKFSPLTAICLTALLFIFWAMLVAMAYYWLYMIVSYTAPASAMNVPNSTYSFIPIWKKNTSAIWISMVSSYEIIVLPLYAEVVY